MTFPPKSLADWEALARSDLKGAAPESLAWTTPEGIVVKPLYTAADLEGLSLIHI
jgi:methylmalonyl-CoA mutase